MHSKAFRFPMKLSFKKKEVDHQARMVMVLVVYIVEQLSYITQNKYLSFYFPFTPSLGTSDCDVTQP